MTGSIAIRAADGFAAFSPVFSVLLAAAAPRGDGGAASEPVLGAPVEPHATGIRGFGQVCCDQLNSKLGDGERAGTRTLDLLIKSLFAEAFSSTKSTKAVANRRHPNER